MTKEHHVEAFVQATIECFESMVDIVPEKKEIRTQIPPIQNSDVCAIIGLSGESAGMVTISFNTEVAKAVVGNFLGEDPASLGDEDLYDAVGELINIIAGNGKAYVKDVALSISLPSVMHGDKYYMSLPKSASVTSVDFDLPGIGLMTMMLTLVD